MPPCAAPGTMPGRDRGSPGPCSPPGRVERKHAQPWGRQKRSAVRHRNVGKQRRWARLPPGSPPAANSTIARLAIENAASAGKPEQRRGGSAGGYAVHQAKSAWLIGRGRTGHKPAGRRHNACCGALRTPAVEVPRTPPVGSSAVRLQPPALPAARNTAAEQPRWDIRRSGDHGGE